jgi:hypothetical protein
VLVAKIDAPAVVFVRWTVNDVLAGSRTVMILFAENPKIPCGPQLVLNCVKALVASVRLSVKYTSCAFAMLSMHAKAAHPIAAFSFVFIVADLLLLVFFR